MTTPTTTEKPTDLLNQLDAAISDTSGSCACTDAEGCAAHDLIDRLGQRVKELEGALGLAMRTLSGEILQMQGASIAERIQPGTGIQWIDNSLLEALTYPCEDGAWGPVWDGRQSAQDWFDVQRASDDGEA